MNSRWNENLITLAMTLVLTCSDGRIKTRVFRAHQELTPGQTWSKLLKIFKEIVFDIKPRKRFFCEDFDPLVNLRLTRGILVILAEKGILSAPVSEWVTPHYYICSCDPMERK